LADREGCRIRFHGEELILHLMGWLGRPRGGIGSYEQARLMPGRMLMRQRWFLLAERPRLAPC
jgi:hypothetical protein